MNNRTFRFRLRSSHRAPERTTQDLVVEFLSDSGLWEPQQLSLSCLLRQPNFRALLPPRSIQAFPTPPCLHCLLFPLFLS